MKKTTTAKRAAKKPHKPAEREPALQLAIRLGFLPLAERGRRYIDDGKYPVCTAGGIIRYDPEMRLAEREAAICRELTRLAEMGHITLSEGMRRVGMAAVALDP